MSVTIANTDAQLSGKTLVTTDANQTIDGLKTYDRGASAPFAVVSGAAKVTNLDADKLDGLEGAAYAVLANATAFLSSLTVTTSLGMVSGQKLYLDGIAMTGDTYILESAANVLSLFSGGVEAKLTSGVLTLGASGTHTIAGSVAFGTSPATLGMIRFPNNEFIKSRNAANSADLSVIGVDSLNKIRIDADGSGTTMSGALSVAGALSKGSGSFLIDHPLKALAQTHDLYHGFIEGPRHDLIYRGVAPGAGVFSIDAASRMTPGTFEALTQQPQVWAQHESGAPVRVSVVGGDVIIECVEPGRVSWLVLAERADPFIRTSPSVDEDGRLIPEARKADGQGLRH